MQIGVVTGLAAEAGCLRQAGVVPASVRCTGARPGAAAAAAEALIAGGCRGLVSFGTAGGLKPGMAPGTLVLATAAIMADGTRLAVDPAWHGRLWAGIQSLSPVTEAIAALAEPLLDPAAKAARLRATGAAAVDMESGEVGRCAAAAGIPFLVVRAVADPAERAIPPWVMQAVTVDGRTRVRPVLAQIVRNPAVVPALVRLAGDARRAMRSLSRVAALAGPLLAFDR